MIRASRPNDPAPVAEQWRIAARVYTALDLLLLDKAGPDEFRDVCDAINEVRSLIKLGKVEPEMKPRVKACELAMADAAEAYRAGGILHLPTPAVGALKSVCEVYVSCVQKLAKETMTLANITTIARQELYEGQPGVTVVELETT